MPVERAHRVVLGIDDESEDRRIGIGRAPRRIHDKRGAQAKPKVAKRILG